MELTDVGIARPCDRAWESMVGTETQRHCTDCDKTVHDLSAMTRAEAARLRVSAGAERLCARFRFDAEGQVIHRPEPLRRGRLGHLGHLILGAALSASVASAGGCGPGGFHVPTLTELKALFEPPHRHEMVGVMEAMPPAVEAPVAPGGGIGAQPPDAAGG